MQPPTIELMTCTSSYFTEIKCNDVGPTYKLEFQVFPLIRPTRAGVPRTRILRL